MTPFAIIVRARGGGWQILALFPDGRRMNVQERTQRGARSLVRHAMRMTL